MPLTSSEAEDFATFRHIATHAWLEHGDNEPNKALERIQANYERMAEGQPRRLYPHPGVESPS